ncbi:hypothetical protein DERA104750_15065 [Deinococcus radiodurans]
MQSEDVENQLGAVHHLEPGRRLDFTRLGGAELLAEDEQVGVEVVGLARQFFQFARPHQRAGFEVATVDQFLVDDFGPGGARQLTEFFQPLLGVEFAPVNLDQQCPFVVLFRLAGAGRAGNFFLQRRDLRAEVELVDLERLRGRQDAPVFFLAHRAGRGQVGGVDQAGAPVVADLDGRNRVQALEEQRGEVALAERPATGMGVQQVKPRQTVLAQTQVGKLGAPGVGHADRNHAAPAVDQHADLAPHVMRQFGQVTGQFGRTDAPRLDAAAI